MARNTLFAFFFFLSSSVFSQQSIRQNAFLDSASHTAKVFYTETRGIESHIYNGVEFKEYNIHNYDIGIPFFLTKAWLDGKVTYDGRVYDNLHILYDLTRDKVIIEHPNGHFKLELINEKINSFSIVSTPDADENLAENHTHNFVKLIVDSTSQSILRPGFYDLLYNGDVKVYVKRKKEIQTSTDARIEITEYRDRNQFFIYKDEKYFQVKSKGSLLNVFFERKNMLRKYLSENKIKFAKNREDALVRSAAFYDKSGK